MGPGSEKVLTEHDVAPLNFIYACSICCASFADVYDGYNETVQGLSDGINPKQRLVTRLFLATCCHVFCSTHLEGGGAPFHPAGQRPKAPCPVCIKEKGDSEQRELYSIRGFNKDEYDPQIPPSWFTAPPIRLDGSGKEMEALRFQYIALIRYCQNTHATRKPLQNALAEIEKKLASMQDLASSEYAKVLNLQQENEQLRAKEEHFQAMKAEVERLQRLEHEVEHSRRLNVNPRDLETFTTNKEAIRHYLKLFPMVLDQNAKLQKRLAQLGFAMALEPIPNFKEIDPHAFDSDEAYSADHLGDSGAFLRKTASSHTAGRSAHTSGRPGTASSSPFIQRPMKRQRLNSPLPGNMQIEHPPRDMQVDHPPSRDAMPPPPKPMSRMTSVRKMFPTLRKKFSHGRSTPVVEDISEGNGDVQMHDNGQWQSINDSRHSPHSGFRSETPYMSGALPVERSSQVSIPRESQLLSSMGVQDERPGFTFRASSPVKINKHANVHQPVQLHTEPSYIRLMDGLSRDNGVELGLKDPRESMTRDYHNEGGNRQVEHTSQNRREPEELGNQKRWGLGHPYLHQPLHGSSPSVNVRQDPQNPSHTNGYTNRILNQPTFSPTTPALRRHQQPGHQIESVVSPSFRSSQNQAPIYSRPGLAEPQDSSNRSGVYLSQRSKMSDPQAGWREPRSLNRLSFFDSPVNSKNEPIEYNRGRRVLEQPPPSDHYQSRHLDSRGFIIRPETGGSPYVGDSAYGTSQNQPSYSRQAPTYSQSPIPSSTFNRSSYNRTGQPPSVVPSIISGRSPVRTQPQWQNLQRMGVRSSRNNFSSIAGNTLASPSRNLFSSAGRRSVRR
ncbi:hypothetical protein EJ02DRAFT_349017 [Clathrospora elynae]|uniref:Uncharacterized protein n=1 Tax=Clathrospora elynae TaxID=706981 RepID=A0A6A5SV53_9PLEO|nr:hypothetical protein EJ02DRAFT_349017 [Clathrospora elynae]